MKKAVIVVSALFVLTACATAEMTLPHRTTERTAPFTCDVGPVPVSVFYNEYIAVLEPIVVRGQDKWICWQLDTAAASIYKFLPDSIAINDTQGNAFSNCKGGKDGDQDGFSRIRCHDKNPKKDKYKYKLKVERQDGTQGPPPYDPQIFND